MIIKTLDRKLVKSEDITSVSLISFIFVFNFQSRSVALYTRIRKEIFLGDLNS